MWLKDKIMRDVRVRAATNIIKLVFNWGLGKTIYI